MQERTGDAMLISDGYQIHFEDTGSGVPVLFVPGSYSTPAAWRGVGAHLADRYRLIGTSLNGYGNTAETRSIGDADITHGVRVIEAVAARIGEPLHLVGHSFGGYIALAAALAGNIELLSLSLFEANPMPLVKPSRMDLFALAEKMTADFAAAIAAEQADAAGLIIDFWGGRGSFQSMPETVRAYCRTTTAANLLDWHGALAADLTAHDCVQLDCDVLLVRGSEANSLIVAITDLLRENLPNAQPRVVAGAGHFLISSHADECGALLAGFLSSSWQP